MIIAGNWKMNMTRDAARSLVTALSDDRANAAGDSQMVVFPPAVLIDTVCAAASGLAASGLAVGGQDCHAMDSGAHTGDIAAPMLAEAGCQWVLVGHSERRADHGESSAMVADKARAAIRAGLKVMICVGETLDEREAGRANEVVGAQVLDSLPEGLTADQFAIAYEPVWAIGTGKVASPDDVDDMHNHIRAVLTGRDASYDRIDILYGGSVKPDNAEALLGLDNVGGALVGGASLKADDFIAIARAAG
ncbi:MAG: triose-phosphate isomerase [Alphaproteobacteria bacterium]|nr:triose-phosphate isomerase [Alphaproteobacteria bacterium]